MNLLTSYTTNIFSCDYGIDTLDCISDFIPIWDMGNMIKV